MPHLQQRVIPRTAQREACDKGLKRIQKNGREADHNVTKIQMIAGNRYAKRGHDNIHSHKNSGNREPDYRCLSYFMLHYYNPFTRRGKQFMQSIFMGCWCNSLGRSICMRLKIHAMKRSFKCTRRWEPGLSRWIFRVKVF